MRPGYRVRQFWGALCPAQPVDEAPLKRYLNDAQIALFRRMSMSEQRHAIAVLDTLELDHAVEAEPCLAQAALLHDVGKVDGNIHLWHRVAVVLLHSLSPALLSRLATGESQGWRYPFFVLLHHAGRGGDLSAGVGTDACAVALIRAHHTAPEASDLDARARGLLRALRSADELN